MQFHQLQSRKGLSWWEEKKNKRVRVVEDKPRESSSENVEQSAYPFSLLWSAKLCFCFPFQGTPGVLALIWCSQNALQCHLFKHSEPLANREKPLFIKLLILAAWMTTWLTLKGTLKSFTRMGGGNLYREGHGSLILKELWRMNKKKRWGTVSSRQLMKGRDGLDVKCVTETERERKRRRDRKCLTGNNGWEVEVETGWEQERACDWLVVADSEGPDENTSGWDNE